MIDSIGDQVKIQRLKLGDVRARIIAARAACDVFNAGVPNWEFPVDFKKQREPFVKLYDEYADALDQVRRHEVAVKRTHESTLAAGTNAKAAWRGERNKLKGFFMSRGVAEPIAKLMADGMWCGVSPPENKKITLLVNSPTCAITASSSHAMLKEPFVVRFDEKRTDSESSPYELAFAKSFLENQQAALNVVRDCVAVMRVPPGLSSAIGVFDLHSAIDLGIADASGTKLVSINAGPAALWCNKTETMNLSYQANPFKELPVFLQVMVGRAAVVVLSAATVEKMGDVASAIDSAEASEISKEAFYLLEKGDTVWVPPAGLAVCVGIPQCLKFDGESGVDTKACKPNQWHSYGMAVYPAFSVPCTEAICSTAQRASMLASWTRSRQWLPEPWKANKEIIAWVEALSDEKKEADNGPQQSID